MDQRANYKYFGLFSLIVVPKCIVHNVQPIGGTRGRGAIFCSNLELADLIYGHLHSACNIFMEGTGGAGLSRTCLHPRKVD